MLNIFHPALQKLYCFRPGFWLDSTYWLNLVLFPDSTRVSDLTRLYFFGSTQSVKTLLSMQLTELSYQNRKLFFICLMFLSWSSKFRFEYESLKFCFFFLVFKVNSCYFTSSLCSAFLIHKSSRKLNVRELEFPFFCDMIGLGRVSSIKLLRLTPKIFH